MENYKGEIKDFPTEIVEKMLAHQVKQGNERDVSVFEKRRTDGFRWDLTVEGCAFWKSVILAKKFDVFFEKYPKETKEETKELTEPQKLEQRIKKLESTVAALSIFAVNTREKAHTLQHLIELVGGKVERLEVTFAKYVLILSKVKNKLKKYRNEKKKKK